MAFASLLGGLVTVIGTSNNVVINGVLRDRQLEPFALFEFAHYGLILVGVGALYALWPGRQHLPKSDALIWVARMRSDHSQALVYADQTNVVDVLG